MGARRTGGPKSRNAEPPSHRRSLIVFDLDGTLVDSVGDIIAGIHHGVAAVGAPSVTDEQVRALIGLPLAEMYAKLLPDSPCGAVEDAAAAYRRFYIEHCADRTRAFPGVRECLDRLSDVALAVATTKMTFMAVEVLKKLDMADRFALIQGSDGIPFKPDPAILHIVLEKLRRPASKAWMVGDTVYDVRAGKAADMRTCAVTWGIGSEAALAAEAPDLLLDSLADLPDLLGYRLGKEISRDTQGES